MILFGLKSLDTVTINYPDRKRNTTSRRNSEKEKQHREFVQQERQTEHPEAELGSVPYGIYSEQNFDQWIN